MKVPFRWGNSGSSSRCGADTASAHHQQHGGPRNKKELARLAKTRTKDSLDTTKGSLASCYEESSKPVDMDQFCEEDASNISDAAAVVSMTDQELEPSMVKDGAGEEKSTLEAVVGPQDDRRMSALTKAMTMKQANLTKAMEGLFDDACAVLVMQHLDPCHDTQAGRADDDNPTNISQLKERVAENLKKQGRVTKQFIDLIRHLEDEAMKKEAINHALQKRLKLANQLLEAEGVDAVESCVVPSSVIHQYRSSHRKERQRQSTTMPRRTPPEIMFAITEIFCNHDVEEELDDLTCHFSEAAQVVAPEDKQQPVKESPPPHSPLTDRTVITDDSIQVAGLQSEKELLEF
jgi:hypothetical protein